MDKSICAPYANKIVRNFPEQFRTEKWFNLKFNEKQNEKKVENFFFRGKCDFCWYCLLSSSLLQIEEKGRLFQSTLNWVYHYHFINVIHSSEFIVFIC